MITVIMSALILIMPFVAVGFISAYVWRSGFLARVCVLLFFGLCALEVHSTLYPDKLLKEKYTRLLSPMNLAPNQSVDLVMTGDLDRFPPP